VRRTGSEDVRRGQRAALHRNLGQDRPERRCAVRDHRPATPQTRRGCRPLIIIFSSIPIDSDRGMSASRVNFVCN
jgi:hypothetical protein